MLKWQDLHHIFISLSYTVINFRQQSPTGEKNITLASGVKETIGYK